MKTPPFKLSVLVLLTLNLLLMYCSSNSATTTTVVAQGTGSNPVKPDHPGGKGHTDPTNKVNLKKLTKNYADIHFPGSTLPTEEDPKLYYIDRAIVDSILKQTGCVGLRIYPAYANNTTPYKPRLIIVGVERGPGASGKLKDMNDKFNKQQLVQQECTVIETDDKCPSNCDGTYF